jgi:putative transposase
VKRVAETLGVARSSLVVALRGTGPLPVRAPPTVREEELLRDIKTLVGARPTYGYRRVTAMLNRARREQGAPAVNHKRVYRLMSEHKLLLARHSGRIPRTHSGGVATLKSDIRWCSDIFQVNCWNGEHVYVAFALDCCDREAISFVAEAQQLKGGHLRDLAAQAVEARFTVAATRTPHPIEWLSDNGPQYTSRDTQAFLREVGFLARNTPAYSPQSNGMAESFVKTFKRDYVYVNDVPDANTVLAMLPIWFADYNHQHPHKALGMRSPAEFRSTRELKIAA